MTVTPILPGDWVGGSVRVPYDNPETATVQHWTVPVLQPAHQHDQAGVCQRYLSAGREHESVDGFAFSNGLDDVVRAANVDGQQLGVKIGFVGYSR